MEIRHKLARAARALLREEGTTTLEMAFVLPPILLLIMGTLEFGIIFHIQSLMTYAGNEAARLGKTGDTYDDRFGACTAPTDACRSDRTMSVIRNTISPWVMNPSDLVISQSAYGNFNSVSSGGASIAGTGGSGQIVLYTVTLNWKILTPLVGQMLGERIPLTARVLVKNEGF